VTPVISSSVANLGDSEAPVTEARRPSRIAPSYLRSRIVAMAIGAVLIVAAGLKAYFAAPGAGFLHWPIVQAIQVEGELALGFWLITGLYPRRAGRVALVCFMIFAMVAGYKAWSREATCGCFGKVAVPPIYTTIFDVTCICALRMFCVRGDAREAGARHGKLRLIAAASWMLALGLGAGVLMIERVPCYGRGRRSSPDWQPGRAATVRERGLDRTFLIRTAPLRSRLALKSNPAQRHRRGASPWWRCRSMAI
jgi:hypothetical protein